MYFSLNKYRSRDFYIAPAPRGMETSATCNRNEAHQNVGHVFNVTTLIRHAASVTYKVEAIFEADTERA